MQDWKETPSPSLGEVEHEELKSTAPSSASTIGIIFPPPEVRNIVDKTADFVARNGPEFENRIRQNEIENRKFNFLKFGDPYNAYYQHKVQEFKKQDLLNPSLGSGFGIGLETYKNQQNILKKVEPSFVDKGPPPRNEFIIDHPTISAMDLDIIKLTAQFVARNGRPFLTNLMNKEQRNSQFDFLRPQHCLFGYFTKLLNQYTKVLIPSRDVLSKLRNEIENPDQVPKNVKYRAEWFKHQESLQRLNQQELEKDRREYSQIDWHDFVVVETIDYQPSETGNFPAPTTPDQIDAVQTMRKCIDDIQLTENESNVEISNSEINDENFDKDNNQVEDMVQDSSEDEEMIPPDDLNKIESSLPPIPGNIVIKKGYDPKQKIIKAATKTDEYLISPITGEFIPSNKVQEHVRINLLDSRWVEQRDKQMDKLSQDNILATGTAIETSLKQLAERRTDIFGIGCTETGIGKKIGEEIEKSSNKVTWDGYNSSVQTATRAALTHITLEEQIRQIHKIKGLLPDQEKEKIGPKPAKLEYTNQTTANSQAIITANPKPFIPSQFLLPPIINVPPMSIPPPPPIMIRPPMLPIRPILTPAMSPFIPHVTPEITHILNIKRSMTSMLDTLGSKKLRTEDSLIPEQQFLTINRNPVQLSIALPNSDKNEWKLNGQIISVILQPTDTISTMKARISEQIGMPPAKQKLQYEGIFFKDNNTVAFYNLVSGTVVTLQPKERGGRKK